MEGTETGKDHREHVSLIDIHRSFTGEKPSQVMELFYER